MVNNNEYDLELKEDLFNYFSSGKIKETHKSVELFKDLNKFYPQKNGRLKWSEIPHVVIRKGDTNEAVWVEKISIFLKDFFNKEQIKNLQLVLFGDNLTESTYQFSLDTFLLVYWNFFSIPQHNYLLSEDKKICINYTFEDELYITSRDI